MIRTLISLLICGSATAQAGTFEIIATSHNTADVVVAVRADSRPLQTQLDELHRAGGGTLFLPAGRHELRQTLVIPQGCGLRGDHDATVLAILQRDGEAVRLSSASSLRGVALWWPDQDANHIVEYPPGITAPGTTTFEIEDVTFINAHEGIRLGPEPNSLCLVRRVRGTCLKRGLFEDRCKGVPRFQHLSFSPKYWEESGLPGAPLNAGPHRDWMRRHGTGIEWADADAFNVFDAEIEGYARGMAFVKAKVAASTGDLVDVRVRDCETAVEVESIQGSVRFTNCDFTGKRYGLRLTQSFGSPTMHLLLSHCRVSHIQDDSATRSDGLIHCVGGSVGKVEGTQHSTYSFVPSSNPPPDVSSIDEWPLSAEPARRELFIVRDPTQLQAVLNTAGSSGGGIVFLPAGTYPVRQRIRVPRGVELRGPLDFWQRQVGRRMGHLGTVLHVDGQGGVDLEAESGLRGLTLYYPQQSYHAPREFPFAVRGLGSQIYVSCCFFVNPHSAIDLATHRCDRFLLDRVLLNPIAHGLRVGSGTTDGLILNTHMNTALWAHGFWPGGPPNLADKAGIAFDETISERLVAYDFSDCSRIRLMSCFTHGAKHLYRLADAELDVVLAGAESTVEAVMAERLGPGGVNLVNFHVLPTKGHHRVPFTLRSSLRPESTIRGWNTLVFGYPAALAEVHGGRLDFELLWEFNSRTASRLRTRGPGQIHLAGCIARNPVIFDGTNITAQSCRFDSFVGKSNDIAAAPSALVLLEEPPVEYGLRLLSPTLYAPQVCAPAQLDVLLPARVAPDGVMQFECPDFAFEPRQLLVSWYDGAPAGSKFTIEADGNTLSTLTATGSRQWKVESLPLKTTPKKIALRFTDAAAIAISQVELRGNPSVVEPSSRDQSMR